jgi:hypothetical protein
MGCLLRTALVLAACVAFTGTLVFLLAPWNFYYGGHFHLFGGWSGWGKLHSNVAGGDYHLWIQLGTPTPGRYKSPLKGTAILCTPRGEHYWLHFGGSLPRDHGTDLAGVPLHLYLYQYSNFSMGGDQRPHIDLYGAFGDSRLALEDRGSIARAFNSDGSLSKSNVTTHSRPTENIQFTLLESSAWRRPPCPPASAAKTR